MTKRLTMQAQRSEEKKKAIYETAISMFEEHGYEQTTVRDICKNAGITTSSFYNFFGDKKGILLQFYYETLREGAAFLEPTEENLAAPYQSICWCFTSMASFCDRNSRDVILQALISLPALTSGQYPSLPRNDVIRQVTNFLEEGKKRGTVPQERDCATDAEYLLMGANGITMYWLLFAESERYISVARRLMPTLFASVTNEAIRV